MTGKVTENAAEQLKLEGRLSDLALLPKWIETLAARYSIPQDVEFAINLCLEEAISNVIRHGYGGGGDRPVLLRFTMPDHDHLAFSIDDEAPHFNPLDEPELPPLNPHEAIRIGGQGLRLLRRFASALEYEPTLAGNRLTITFSTTTSAA